jgi:hypothetical protein
MMIRVKSPPEELAEIYANETPEQSSIKVWISDRCFERGELVNELSHELAELQCDYDDVCRRLKKYEPDFVAPEIKPYDPTAGEVILL